MKWIGVLFAVLFVTATACRAQDLFVFYDRFQDQCVTPDSEGDVCKAEPKQCDTEQPPSELDVYFFDVSQGGCRRYSSALCCNPATDSNCFASMQECTLGCVGQCRQPAPTNDGKCWPSIAAYFYDGEACVETQWDNCKTTTNVFETADECRASCIAVSGQADQKVRVARQAPPVINVAPASPVDVFCNDFKAANPEKAETLNIGGEIVDLPAPTNPEISETPKESAATEAEEPTNDIPTEPGPLTESAATEAEEPTNDIPTEPGTEASNDNETMTESPLDRNIFVAAPPQSGTCAQLRCIRNTVTTRTRLNWVSVYAKDDCIEVVVRLNCRRGLFNRPSDNELTRLCGLAKSGIERYWSRQVARQCNGQAVTSNVRVRVQLLDRFLALNAKEVVVKAYTKEPVIGNTRSHNSDILPLTLKYNYGTTLDAATSNNIFQETAAHELGHSILRAARGFTHSWTHKGTSTWYGKLLNTDRQPASGEIDLMKYFAGRRRADWMDRTLATEEDVLSLIDEAKFSYCTSGSCGAIQAHSNGHPCYKGSECASGRCQFFRCVACTKDSHCSPSRHCANRLKFWEPNTCRKGLEHGSLCVRDRQCESKKCHAGRCGDCERDSDCKSGQYCSGKNLLIFKANRCEAGLKHGSFCVRDRQCESGKCHAGRCGDCERDSDCQSGQYCSGRNLLALKANRCVVGKSHGAACTRDAECANERCHGLRCGECEQDSHCGPNQYCSGRNLPLIKANRCVAARGYGAPCTRDAQCDNNRCHGLLCGECETDAHCSSGSYCSGRNLPLLQANRCVKDLAHGSLCVRNAQCSSNRCHAGRCGECIRDDHCPAREYCSGRNALIFKANRCQAAKGNRATCTRDRECSSGRCHGIKCGECEKHSHCPTGQYCKGLLNLLSANVCVRKNGIGVTCTSDAQCSSNHCNGGRCGECDKDTDCPADRYCAGQIPIPLKISRCVPRKGKGGFCSRNRHCANNRCHGTRCGDCEQDSHCSANQYCSGTANLLSANDCTARKRTGSLCTRDRQCSTGRCITGRCSECENDGHCPRDHYCGGVALFEYKSCKAKKCSGFCTSDRQCRNNNCRWYLRCKC